MATAGMLGDPRELVAEVERLLGESDTITDPAARELSAALVQALVDLYGAGLERIVDVLAEHDGNGEMAATLADDELVAHLLLLHGLHPVGLEQRVSQALAEVRPYLQSHGGDVELLGVEGATVSLRLAGSCNGCPSSAMTLKLAIEDSIHKYAPEIEDVVAQEPPAAPALLQIELGGMSPAVPTLPLAAAGGGPAQFSAEPAGSWTMAGGLPDLVPGRPLVKRVGEAAILFLRLGDRTLGYGDRCPACASSLAGAALEQVALVCPGCGNRYDAIRAGRCLDSPQLSLQPVPLLVGADGLVKVAVEVAA